MNFIRKHKYLLAFLSSVLLDFWFSMCAWSANHNILLVGIFANITYPFVNMLPVILLIEEEDLKNKLKIALFNGLGYATGAVIFFFIRENLINR